MTLLISDDIVDDIIDIIIIEEHDIDIIDDIDVCLDDDIIDIGGQIQYWWLTQYYYWPVTLTHCVLKYYYCR